MAKSLCLVDGAYGIYVPQRYAVLCSADDMLTDEQREVLEAGPEHSEYWDVWDEVLDSVEVKRGNSLWHLELSESGDVMLVENN